MKRNSFIYPAGLLLLACLTLNSCNRQEEEPNRETPETPVETDPEDEELITLPKYVFLDKCDDLGEWDAAVFGLNSMSYLYRFKEDSPSEFVVWNGKNSLIQHVVLFDRDGLPAMMLAGEYTFLTGNYRGNKFDLVLLRGDKTVFTDSIGSETDWDAYRTDNISLLSTRAPASRVSLARRTVEGTAFVLAALASAPVTATEADATTEALIKEALAAAAVTLSDIHAITAFLCDECAEEVDLAAAVAGSASDAYQDGQIITVSQGDIEKGLFKEAIRLLTEEILENGGGSLANKIADKIKANMDLFLRVNASVIEIERESAEVKLSALYINPIEFYADQPDIMKGLQTIGICLSTTPNPAVGDRTVEHAMALADWNHLINEQAALVKSKLAMDLKPNTTYYYRSFYNYGGRIVYGDEKSFKTKGSEVKVTLLWDFVADVDVHVIEPSGFEIYFADRYSSTGGFLDYDNVVAYGPENIYWSHAPKGAYYVFLHHYSGVNAGNYTVTLRINDQYRMFRGHIGIAQTVPITWFDPEEGILENRSMNLRSTEMEAKRITTDKKKK